MPIRNNFLNLVFISFSMLIIFNAYAQEQERYFNNDIDSTFRYQGIIPPIEFQYNFDEIFSKSFTNDFSSEVLLDNNPSTVWLRTELLISTNSEEFVGSRINTHFTSPLYQQYLKNSEFDMVRYVLGIAQTSAVAYMAYRHIKKYGFWK
jgi:hypothetical protein